MLRTPVSAAVLLCAVPGWLPLGGSGGPLAAQVPGSPPRLEAEQAVEASALIDAMKANPRGPYARIRWFCSDGSVQPPTPRACAERGGGVQHAELSDEARRLAALGFHVGTILQATPADSLIDAASAHYRLKEWILQRHLFQVDDGWVMRRARYYRGARQAEDEEARGRELLHRLLADAGWLRRHHLLALRAVATVPHPGAGTGDLSDRIRNLIADLADRDPALQPLRVKIHSLPSRDDIQRVEARLPAVSDTAIRRGLTELLEMLRRRYDPATRAGAFARFRAAPGRPFAAELEKIEADLAAGSVEAAFRRLAGLAPSVREAAEADAATAAARLWLLDLQLVIHDVALAARTELAPDLAAPRRRRIEALLPLVDLGYGAGLLSGRERSALRERISTLLEAKGLRAGGYRDDLAYISRALDWSYATARSHFGELEARYLRVEPRAAGFVDALVRNSAALGLAESLGALTADADRVLGATHSLFGAAVPHGVRGMNPGVAVGTMEMLPVRFDPSRVVSDRIYVLPETPSELRPVAGVLTLDAGNLLSHVQLLARNLGIPNASILPEHQRLLQAGDGRAVMLAVSPAGQVVLKEASEMDAADHSLLAPAADPAAGGRVALDLSRLDLSRIDPIPLDSLRSRHAGVWVGPKAANLGQLMAEFPGYVAPGTALPFGLFLRHADRPFEGRPSVLGALREAYRTADSLRASGAPEARVDSFMFARLEWTRRAIQELSWIPEDSARIRDALQETFGAGVAAGVFVRSDTNVEDLPRFSGAGLNLTVPHVVREADLLAGIRRVWTSPFTERAYLWRRQVLIEQGDVYPSVLLLRSVHSEKSGVLITSGLQAGGPDDLTVAVAEGVGGAVDGEDAETVLVHPGGDMTLLSQAKAPLRRHLVAEGGVRWLPATRPDTLLTPADVAELQAVVDRWHAGAGGRAEAEVWDFEFGFADGRLWLFQVRPFVRFRSSETLARLERLDEPIRARSGRQVSLEEIP